MRTLRIYSLTNFAIAHHHVVHHSLFLKACLAPESWILNITQSIESESHSVVSNSL